MPITASLPTSSLHQALPDTCTSTSLLRNAASVATICTLASSVHIGGLTLVHTPAAIRVSLAHTRLAQRHGKWLQCCVLPCSLGGRTSSAVPRADGVVTCDPGDWRAVVINLPRRMDRWSQLKRTLAIGNLDLLSRLSRIDAVDGQSIDLSNEALNRFISVDALKLARRAKAMGAFTVIHHEGQLIRFHDHLTEGGIACAMSHHAALTVVAEHLNADWGLILEDDVCSVVPHVHEVIARLLQRVPPDWDALFLGYHGGVLAGSRTACTDTSGKETQARLEMLVEEAKSSVNGFPGAAGRGMCGDTSAPYDPPVLRMFLPIYGLYAWMVRKQAARALLQEAFPIDGQVDYALSQWLVRKRGRSFRVAPRHLLFFSPKSEDGLDSDVQTMASFDELLSDPQTCDRYMSFINEFPDHHR